MADDQTSEILRPLRERILETLLLITTKLVWIVAGYDAFISYTSRGHNSGALAYARSLRQELEQQGREVFLDETRVIPGDSLLPSIQTAIRRSNAIIVLMSPGVSGSDWVRLEVAAAQAFGLSIIPIVFPNSIDKLSADDTLRSVATKLRSLRESEEQLAVGPSLGVLDALLQARVVARTRRTRRRFRFGVAAAFAITLVAATVLASSSIQQRAIASKQLHRLSLVAAGAALETNQVEQARDWIERTPREHQDLGWALLRREIPNVVSLRDHPYGAVDMHCTDAARCWTISTDGAVREWRGKNLHRTWILGSSGENSVRPRRILPTSDERMVIVSDKGIFTMDTERERAPHFFPTQNDSLASALPLNRSEALIWGPTALLHYQSTTSTPTIRILREFRQTKIADLRPIPGTRRALVRLEDRSAFEAGTEASAPFLFHDSGTLAVGYEGAHAWTLSITGVVQGPGETIQLPCGTSSIAWAHWEKGASSVVWYSPPNQLVRSTKGHTWTHVNLSVEDHVEGEFGSASIDGRYITIDVGGETWLVDVLGAGRERVLHGHGYAWTGGFSSDGRAAITSGDDGVLRWWPLVDVFPYRSFAVCHPKSRIGRLALSADQARIAAVCFGYGDSWELVIASTQDGRIIASHNDISDLVQVVFIPTGYVYTSSTGHVVHRTAAETRWLARYGSGQIADGRTLRVALNGDNELDRLFVTDGSGLTIIDVQRRSATSIVVEEPVLSFTVNEDGTIYLATANGPLRVAYHPDYEPRVLAGMPTYPGSAAGYNAVTVPGNGELLAAGAMFGIVTVFDTTSETLIWSRPAHNNHVGDLFFDRSGGSLASVSWDGDLVVWDVESGARLFRMRHPSTASGVVTVDSTLVVSGHSRGTIRIYDLYGSDGPSREPVE